MCCLYRTNVVGRPVSDRLRNKHHFIHNIHTRARKHVDCNRSATRDTLTENQHTHARAREDLKRLADCEVVSKLRETAADMGKKCNKFYYLKNS